MNNKEKLVNEIDNLNEKGIDDLLFLIAGFSTREIYNINTTPERLAELKEIDREREKKIQQEREEAEFEYAKAAKLRSNNFKDSLTGKEKRFFEIVSKVKIDTRYCMELWEMFLLANTYNNNLIDGCYDIFRYGFLKGQRAEKARRKKVSQ